MSFQPGPVSFSGRFDLIVRFETNSDRDEAFAFCAGDQKQLKN